MRRRKRAAPDRMFRLVVLISPTVLAKIEKDLRRQAPPVNRSDYVRALIERAISDNASDSNRVRATGT